MLFFYFCTDLDDGESLKNLFEAEKELFGNNFPQVLMAHAASSLCANFDLAIETFDGFGIPVLVGHPVSGKSTALKAVLSVFGDNTLVNSEYYCILSPGKKGWCNVQSTHLTPLWSGTNSSMWVI